MNAGTDMVIGTINTPAALYKATAGQALGKLSEIPTPDWSNNLVTYESSLEHKVSKGAGTVAILAAAAAAGGGNPRAMMPVPVGLSAPAVVTDAVAIAVPTVVTAEVPLAVPAALGAGHAMMSGSPPPEAGGGGAGDAPNAKAPSWSLNERVPGRLADPRMGRLQGNLTAEQLGDLANNPAARRFFDARSNNINIVQEVDGKLLRITVARDKFEIISVGPIQERNIANAVARGDFIELK